MLGLIVNPVAGLGGPVGLKGSDGSEVQARARSLGAVGAARARASAALAALDPRTALLTAGGAMGEDLCREHGLAHRVVARFGAGETSGAETRAATAALVAAGADLILFAGGDGTARDVAAQAAGTPLLGIPAGVKMYSGVFAATPALAGRLAARFLALGPASRRVAEVELLDVDEASLRRDEPAVRLHGTVLAPVSPAVQRSKASVVVDDDGQVGALCADLARRLEPGCLYVVGPGRTTRLFMAACGLPKTLLGVDAMRDGALVEADCSERQLLALTETGPGRIVLGLLGGQGCLLGRGNQPISGRVVNRIGPDRLLVLAGAAKVASLPQGLFADTGDPATDAALAGYLRIHTGPRRSTLLRVRAPAASLDVTG